MPTRHVLTRFALGRQPEVEITPDAYAHVVEAQRRAVEAMSLEDAYDVLLGNYEELERELLAIALAAGVRPNAAFEWNAAIDTISLAGRRLSNLLASATTYRTQAQHLVSRWYGGATSMQARALEASVHREYDRELGYRVCYQLRNHGQHGGPVVHGANVTADTVQGPDGRRAYAVRAFAPEVGVEQLREGGKFKATVLAELEQGGRVGVDGRRMHDLRPFVRAYLTSLGRLHVDLRALIAPEVAAGDAVVEDAVARFVALPDAGDAVGLVAMQVDERRVRVGAPPAWISMQPVERRRAFERRNDSPVHFDQCAVSNAVRVGDRSCDLTPDPPPVGADPTSPPTGSARARDATQTPPAG